MSRVPYKIRLWVGNSLIMLSVFVVIVEILIAPYNTPTWVIILMSFIAALIFIVGFVFIPKTNEDGSPIVINKKEKEHKESNKQKSPLISEQEWKEQEEEDDEMMFIDEDN